MPNFKNQKIALAALSKSMFSIKFFPDIDWVLVGQSSFSYCYVGLGVIYSQKSLMFSIKFSPDIDWVLVGLVLFLCTVGLASIYSAILSIG